MTDQGNIATELDAAGSRRMPMRRLAELQPGRAGSIFTSDLSVNEFLLVREVGVPAASAWCWELDLPRRAAVSAVEPQTRSSTCCPRPCTTRASWP